MFVIKTLTQHHYHGAFYPHITLYTFTLHEAMDIIQNRKALDKLFGTRSIYTLVRRS